MINRRPRRVPEATVPIDRVLLVDKSGVDRQWNLGVFRKSPGIVLTVDFFAVEHDIEDPAGAFDQFGIDLIRAVTLAELRHQTGGLWFVVSLRAVGDPHFHLFSPSRLGHHPKSFAA